MKEKDEYILKSAKETQVILLMRIQGILLVHTEKYLFGSNSLCLYIWAYAKFYSDQRELCIDPNRNWIFLFGSIHNSI